MGRTAIILGVVSLLLLGFIVFFERGSLSTTEREGRKGRILESFVRERVTRIEIQRKGVTTVLVRDEAKSDDAFGDSTFRVEKPYAAAADRDAVESLLGSLEFITPRRSLGPASKEDVVNFGLDKPRYRVSFTAGHDRRSFSIGAPSSDGTGAYLLTTDDKRAYVVGKELVEALDHEPTDFHTKELHEGVSVYTAEKLSVRDASGEHVIEKRDGLFWLARPEPVLASESAVTEIVNGLDALRASRFVTSKPGNLADYGLATPSFTLALDSKKFDTDKKDQSRIERLELRIGHACASHADESYIRVGQGPIMCAADADLAKLRKPAAELREALLLPLDEGAIRGVVLRSGKRELRVEEKDNVRKFRLTTDGRETLAGDVDETAFTDWVKGLRGVRAEAFEEDVNVQLGAPSTTLKFDRGKDKPAYEVVFGRVQGERVAVARGGEKLVAWYGKNALDLVSVTAARFRKLRLLDEDAGAFTKLEVSGAGRASEVVSKRGDRYVLDEPRSVAGTDAERPAVDELLRLTSKLDALRFVADAAAPEHGLAQPAFVVQVEYAGAKDKPAKRHTLKIGATTEGGRFAQLDSDPAVFVVPAALVRQIESPLVSRAALSVPLERLGGFEVIGPADKLQVEWTEQHGFAAVSGDARDPRRGDELARAIATLRASRVLGYGKPAAAEGMDKPQLKVAMKLRGEPAGGDRTLAIGQPLDAEPDSDVYARRTDLDVSFALPRSALEALQPQPVASSP